MGGFRYLNGFPDRPPVRQNLSMGDTVTGIHAALGIAIALLGRERGADKLGQVVDVAIYESMYNLLESVVPEFDYAGVIRECSGSTITGIVPSNTYVSKDKKNVVIAANTDTLFIKLMHAIGRSDLAADPQLQSNAGRVSRQAEIDDAMAAWVATKTKDETTHAMEQAGVPVGLVYSVEDMFNDPQYQHRGMFEEVEIGGPKGSPQKLKVPAIMPKLRSTPGRTTWAGHKIGQDTRDVLTQILKRSDAQIEHLLREEIVFEPAASSA
jgi:crotonobetainyl-CoA:carnitine CoA-transferase CaiB-like acyl-CoA transferase